MQGDRKAYTDALPKSTKYHMDQSKTIIPIEYGSKFDNLHMCYNSKPDSRKTIQVINRVGSEIEWPVKLFWLTLIKEACYKVIATEQLLRSLTFWSPVPSISNTPYRGSSQLGKLASFTRPRTVIQWGKANTQTPRRSENPNSSIQCYNYCAKV